MKNVLFAISIVIISFLLVVPQAWTGSIEVVDPEKAGMSAKVLAGIDEYAEVGIKGKLFKGAVVLVARHGKICYFKSYGEAEQGKAMKTDAVFRQASMTKPLVMVQTCRSWMESTPRVSQSTRRTSSTSMWPGAASISTPTVSRIRFQDA